MSSEIITGVSSPKEVEYDNQSNIVSETSINIIKTGIYNPKKIVHNNDLKNLNTNHEWIYQRTGIETRHIANEHETTYFMAYESAKNITFKNLKMIIVATSTPDLAFPSCASYVHEKLKLHENIMCFDIHDACNGFVQALDIAYQYLSSYDEYSEVLVIGSEKMSKLVDWSDRNTAILFGDGAGSVLLNNKSKVLFRSSKSIANNSILNTNNKHISMNGREVFKNAVSNFSNDIQEASKVCKIDWFIPHQANLRIIESVSKNSKFPMESIFYNGNKYGNTSAASVPLALHEFSHKISTGDVIMFSAFGAGLRGNSICIRV